MSIFELEKDRIVQLPETSFSAEGVKERQDLQRILRSRIEVLDPDLLIIAEEYGDWEESRRRIDLLALDRDAKLVVIELKRTDDGGHMELRLYPDFPKSTNTLYLYILRAKLSVRPAQVDGIYVNIISHGSTPARTRACSDTTPRPDALYRALSRLDAVSDQAHVNVTHCQI